MIYKSYRSIRWLVNITFTSFGALFLAPFNFLVAYAINDLFSDFFDLLGLKKISLWQPTQVEQIKEIVTSTKNKVADKIIDSDIPVVSESLRSRYKNSYFDDMSTMQRFTAYATIFIITIALVVAKQATLPA